MTHQYEAGKEYRTHGGHKATLFTINARGGWPLVGEVELHNGDFSIHAWTEDGKSKYAARDCDLMPPSREVWIGEFNNELRGRFVFDRHLLSPSEGRPVKFREVLDDED